jgi:hypothetical protein
MKIGSNFCSLAGTLRDPYSAPPQVLRQIVGNDDDTR